MSDLNKVWKLFEHIGNGEKNTSVSRLRTRDVALALDPSSAILNNLDKVIQTLEGNINDELVT